MKTYPDYEYIILSTAHSNLIANNMLLIAFFMFYEGRC